MPVRFYMANAAAPITPTADTPPTAWEAVSPNAVTRALLLTPTGESATVSGTFTPAAANTEMRLARFVSPPLSRSVTFPADGGDVDIAFARQRVSGGTAIVSFWRFWGVSGDGATFLGTPFGAPDAATWATTTAVTAGVAPADGPQTPLTVPAGGRVVVDLGFRVTNTTTTTGEIYYGGTAIPDLASGDTGTAAQTRPSWIEWSGLTADDFDTDEAPAVEGDLDASLPVPSANLVGTVRATATLGGTLPVATAALTGTVRATGALTGLLPALTTGLDGTIIAGAQLDAALPLPTAAIDGTTNTGTLAGTLPEPFANLSGGVLDTGALDATLPLPQALLGGDGTAHGDLDASLPVPTATATGTVSMTGALDAQLPLASAALGGDGANTGDLTAELPVPSAGLSAGITVVAVITGVLPSVTASVTAGVTAAATLNSTVPAPTGALEGTTGETRLAATLPLPTAQLAAITSTAGVLAGLLPLLEAALSGFPPSSYEPPLHAGQPLWGAPRYRAGQPELVGGFVAGPPV